jgi:hypothetical protein
LLPLANGVQDCSSLINGKRVCVLATWLGKRSKVGLKDVQAPIDTQGT